MIIHEAGRTYKIGLRAQYKHIRSEGVLRAVVLKTLNGYRARGAAWSAYADALAQKSLVEQLCIIGMISN